MRLDTCAMRAMQAGARICKALGDEFLPYLEVVMPPLLHSAKLQPDVTVGEAESDDEDGAGDGEVSVFSLQPPKGWF